MDTPLESVRVANSFIERFADDGTITHMKLQKLCYFAYGWWLALCPDKPVLMQSRPQVWKLGPVFHPIYTAFASHRSERIGKAAMKPLGPFQGPETVERTEASESKLIDWIWGRYGHYTGIQLSDMTHEVGTPWRNKVEKEKFVVPRFMELEDDEIRPYFQDLARREGFLQ